jgi:hypothetical protein
MLFNDPETLSRRALNSTRSKDISFAELWHCECTRDIKAVEGLTQQSTLHTMTVRNSLAK